MVQPHKLWQSTLRNDPQSPAGARQSVLRISGFTILTFAATTVRSIKDQNRLEELENELSETRFKWSIIGLVRNKEEGRSIWCS